MHRMGLKSEIAEIIRNEVPGCIAEHERDGHDKLHPSDIEQLASAIAKHVKNRKRSK
jgi:hypothetical protein